MYNLFENIISKWNIPGTSSLFNSVSSNPQITGNTGGGITPQSLSQAKSSIDVSNQIKQKYWFDDKDIQFLRLAKEKGYDSQKAMEYLQNKKATEKQWPDLGIMGNIKEGAIGAFRSGEQIPAIAGNVLDFTTQKITWPLISGWLDLLWADQLAERWRQGSKVAWELSKKVWEDITMAGMTDWWLTPLTENQIQARKFGGQMALTAPIWGGYISWSKWLGSLAFRSWVVWAWFWGTQPIINKWGETTLWDIGYGTALGWVTWAIGWPLISKVIAPAIGWVVSKTGKYWTALIKWGGEWLKKSISRDLSGIPKAIQGKAEAISTRANRFNSLDEEKFTKQIGETPGQFAVSRGMTDVWDDAIVKANQNYQKSIQEADKSIGAIEGNFSTKWQKDDILGELVSANKAKMELQPRNPDANKARQLFNKYESWEGLTMAEINEAKRIYQRNHTYTYEQLASNEARNSKYLQDWVREWQFKTAKENGLTNIADINKTTKAWKMWADSLAKKVNRSQANNEFGITDWIALSGGTPENIALFLWKKALSSKYVKSGIIKTLGKQTKPSIIEWTNVWVQQANFQKNVNRGISNNRGDVGGKSMVKPAWLLPAPSGKATGAKNVRVNQPTEQTPIINEGQKWARPITPKKPEAQKLLPAPRIPAWTSLPRTDIVAESMRWVNAKRPEWVTPKVVKSSPTLQKSIPKKKEVTPIVKKDVVKPKPTILDDIKYENEIFKQKKEIIEQLKSKEWERYAKKWSEQVDVLFPDKTNIVKYGKKWITYKEWDKYYFSAFSNTDSPKWSKSFKMDVTDEFPKPSPKPIVKNLQKTEKSATVGDMETKKLIEEARKYKSAEEFIKAVWEWKVKTNWFNISSDRFFGKNANISFWNVREISKPDLWRESSKYRETVDYWKEQIKKWERPVVQVSYADKNTKMIKWKTFKVTDWNHRLQAYKELWIKDIPIERFSDDWLVLKKELTELYKKLNPQ